MYKFFSKLKSNNPEPEISELLSPISAKPSDEFLVGLESKLLAMADRPQIGLLAWQGKFVRVSLLSAVIFGVIALSGVAWMRFRPLSNLEIMQKVYAANGPTLFKPETESAQAALKQGAWTNAYNYAETTTYITPGPASEKCLYLGAGNIHKIESFAFKQDNALLQRNCNYDNTDGLLDFSMSLADSVYTYAGGSYAIQETGVPANKIVVIETPKSEVELKSVINADVEILPERGEQGEYKLQWNAEVPCEQNNKVNVVNQAWINPYTYEVTQLRNYLNTVSAENLIVSNVTQATYKNTTWDAVSSKFDFASIYPDVPVRSIPTEIPVGNPKFEDADLQKSVDEALSYFEKANSFWVTSSPKLVVANVYANPTSSQQTAQGQSVGSPRRERSYYPAGPEGDAQYLRDNPQLSEFLIPQTSISFYTANMDLSANVEVSTYLANLDAIWANETRLHNIMPIKDYREFTGSIIIDGKAIEARGMAYGFDQISYYAPSLPSGEPDCEKQVAVDQYFEYYVFTYQGVNYEVSLDYNKNVVTDVDRARMLVFATVAKEDRLHWQALKQGVTDHVTKNHEANKAYVERIERDGHKPPTLCQTPSDRLKYRVKALN